MNKALVEEVAAALAQARLTKRRVASVPKEALSKLTMEEGYAAMKRTAEHLERANRSWTVQGYKVGATARAAQEKMGLKGPFWGFLYGPAKAVAPHRGGNIPRFSVEHDLIRGVETEFAFTLKRDIAPRSKPYTAEELVIDFCDKVVPCVEVCGSRFPADLGHLAPLLVADTGNTAVVFPAESYASDAAEVYKDVLVKSKATIFTDGEKIAEGSGAEVLGSPALSLEWFVKEAVGVHGLTISKDAYVITGATSGLRPITQACYLHAAFDGPAKCDIHIAFRD